MAAFDFDFFVIGGGSGGVRAARIAATHGARVALAEEFRYGGTCVIRGCVPKKLMVYAAGFADSFADAAGFGWHLGEARFDWPTLIAAKDRELARLEGAYRGNLERAGVKLFHQRAEVADPHRVRLADGSSLTAQQILIATGGRPFRPDLPGAELAITSDQIFDLANQPKRVLIVGGGYIACEFAGILNGLGSQVTQIYRGEQVLRGFDHDLRTHLAGAMVKRGVDLRLNTDLARIERQGDGLLATLHDGQQLTVDQVLLATGRVPNTAGLGLEALGLTLGRRGEIPVDAWSQTAIPSIYAVGDVTDRVNLTPVAIREGHALADTLFAGRPTKVDHSLIPTAVFTQPEIGTCGLSEEAARAQHDVVVFRTRFRPMAYTLAGRDEQMLMKIVVDRPTDKVLGVHIIGPAAGEMIQLVGIAMTMGATKADFDRTIAVHPTAAEELVTLRTPVA